MACLFCGLKNSMEYRVVADKHCGLGFASPQSIYCNKPNNAPLYESAVANTLYTYHPILVSIEPDAVD